MHRTYEKLFFSRQIMCLETQNIDLLIKQYQHDAVLIRFNAIVRGHEEIRKFFTGYFDQHPDLQIKDVKEYHEAENIISGLVVTTSSHSEQQQFFTFLLSGGKIIYDITMSVQERRMIEESRTAG